MEEHEEAEELGRCTSAEERRKILGDLFMRHRERLCRMVGLRLDQRLQGRVDPSDVIQETYLEAFERIDEYLGNPEVSLFVWLRFLACQAVQTLHRKHLGAQARDVRREVSLFRGSMPQATSEALAAHLLGHETSPSERVIRAERKVLLQEKLNGMSSLDREILALRHFEHLSNLEASQVLGITEESAKKRYSRALVRLAGLLRPLE